MCENAEINDTLLRKGFQNQTGLSREVPFKQKEETEMSYKADSEHEI